MSGKELFGALARAVGLYFAIIGVAQTAFFLLGKIVEPSGIFGQYVMSGPTLFVIGLLVFFAANAIAAIAYRQK